ncbi:amidohydrolase family protein [Dactylosporangium sp. NPDC006015]|uniref:amidohydrolase family protein n=1 Tax=Dactylosporangium sp. NPDC006015 TaxID=3154576 RepID=UPI0033AA4777
MTIVLRAARLFDGAAGSLTPDPVVIVDGGRITAAGTGVPVPAGAAVVDLGDATILPGLVDTHVHLAFDASTDPVGALADRDEAAALAAMTAAARHATRGGVTTVRDLGDRGYLALALRDAVAGDPTLPTIVAAGPPITTPGGHCHFLGGAIGGNSGGGAAGVRAAVRERAERGADIVKIMASGGNLTPGTLPERSQFGVAELRAAVDEAHRLGLPVTAHAHGTQAITDALAAGVDGLEHVSFMTADSVEPVPDAVLAAIVARRVALGITIGVRPVPGFTPPPAVLSRLPLLHAGSRRMYEAGAVITAGTDAGIAPIKPPDVVRWAVAQLAGIGMTPVDALRAVTSVAAAVCGLGDRKGRVAPGFDADLLAVAGDPLRDPAALHDIRAVYVRGVPVSH